MVVENGLDYLRHGLEDLGEEPPAYKYAALHLFCAIEVLVKARLIREHWSLACERADNVSLASFEAGDVKTVDPTAGLNRLRKAVGLEIVQRHMDSVEALRKMRNRAAHLAFVGTDDVAARVGLGRGLDFAVWFLAEHIRPGAPDREVVLIEETLDEVRDALAGIEDFVKERLISIAQDLQNAAVLLCCPRCGQDALTPRSDQGPGCLFCLWDSDGEEGAEEYLAAVMGLSSHTVISDGGEWPIDYCPNCETHAFVGSVDIVKDASKDLANMHDPYVPPAYLCFACSYLATHLEIDRCSSCGRTMPAAELSVCFDCIAYKYGVD